MYFLTDSCTDVDIDLRFHVGELGAAWSRVGGTGGAVIWGNRIKPWSASARFAASGVPRSADYSVTADFVAVANLTNDTAGICARLSSNGADYVLARYEAATGKFWLEEIAAGSGGGVSYTDSGLKTSGASRTVKLKVNGNTATLYINGVLRQTLALTTVLNAGAAGVYINVGGTTNLHLDNLSGENTPKWAFESGAAVVPFFVNPQLKGGSEHLLLQQSERDSAGALYVYNKAAKRLDRHQLTVKIDNTVLATLLAFHKTTVRGVALPFTWTDHLGGAHTVRFADRELNAAPDGTGRWVVEMALEELL